MLCRKSILLAISLTVPLAAQAQAPAGGGGNTGGGNAGGPVSEVGNINDDPEQRRSTMLPPERHVGPSRARQQQLRMSSEVRTNILTPLGGVQSSAVSATSLAAPKKAKASFEKGVKELGKGSFARLNKAMDDLQQAVDEYPEYAAAWTLLGLVKSQTAIATAPSSPSKMPSRPTNATSFPTNLSCASISARAIGSTRRS